MNGFHQIKVERRDDPVNHGRLIRLTTHSVGQIGGLRAIVRAMATDYESLYRYSRHALGAPGKQFVSFFEGYWKSRARVLDIGCGQGRDALFIARLGHRVTAVDISPTGIRQLREEASQEGLEIETNVADIRDFVPADSYDIVIIDRVLHMLLPDERLDVLRRLLAFTGLDMAVLIADEKSNIATFEGVFGESGQDWSTMLKERGTLFCRRTG